MLLNEFLKDHRAFLQERGEVQELKATVVQQQKQIEALTFGLQKVSTQLTLDKVHWFDMAVSCRRCSAA